MTEVRGRLSGENATQELGRALVAAADTNAKAAGVILLRGELGAGKSTLARALLGAAGVTGAIKSPTYTLVERYQVQGQEFLHLDLYRIADPDELEYLGLDELAESARLWLIEWPERGGDRLPVADIELLLQHAGDARLFAARSCSLAGEEWLARLRVMLGSNPPTGGDYAEREGLQLQHFVP